MSITIEQELKEILAKLDQKLDGLDEQVKNQDFINRMVTTFCCYVYDA
jgi:hypothetical protein